MKTHLLILSLASLFLQSCGLADLRTPMLEAQGVTTQAATQGRQLLDQAWKNQGLDRLAEHETYEVVASDHWKGMLGSMGKVWPVNQTPLRLRYAVGTFDSNVEILEGKKRGFVAGLQSWQYYEGDPASSPEFQDKTNKRITFGLAAYQYFFELADRLRRAPIVAYAGVRNFDGQTYDLVFATWEKAAPHQGHDQYLLFINQKTGLLEMASYTIRENYLPGPKTLYGTIRFEDFRTIDGILIPFTQSVFLNAPKENATKYVHQLTISSFSFDSFEKEWLYPNRSLKMIGDDKLKATP